MTHRPNASLPLSPPHHAPWILPVTMVAITLASLAAAEAWTNWSRLFYLVPYTFLGNSLAPLPYDGALVYLGSRFSLPLIVGVAVLATLVIEAWNIEVLARILAREGTSNFRNHHLTQWTLRWYRKAPFLSLVATCVLPVVPHYPMRLLVVLAGYRRWKYQLSVLLGRGARYALLASVGQLLPIPGAWIAVASLLALAVGVRSVRRMNQSTAISAQSASPADVGSTSLMVEEA